MTFSKVFTVGAPQRSKLSGAANVTRPVESHSVREVIETDRMILQAATLDDLADMQRSVEASRDSLIQWLPWAVNDRDADRFSDFLTRSMRNRLDGRRYDWVMRMRSDQSFVGMVSMTREEIARHLYSVGAWIDISKQRMGLASEALRAMTDHGLDCGVKTYVSMVAPGNFSSFRLDLKSGFRYFGRTDDGWLMMVRGDWPPEAL